MVQPIEDMGMIAWKKLNAFARSTIRLHLAKSVYFTILEATIAHVVWQKLCSTYEKNTVSNKVFLMHRLYNLRMKKFASVVIHLNEFDSLFAHIRTRRFSTHDVLKMMMRQFHK